MGSEFRAALLRYGVQDLTVQAAAKDTGEVLCLVTPDGERSFAYRTGVASDGLRAQELCEAVEVAAEGLELVYFDIYTFLCPESAAEALWLLGKALKESEEGMRRARRCGAKVGLNLGSNGIVQAQPQCKKPCFLRIFEARTLVEADRRGCDRRPWSAEGLTW